MKIFIGCSSSEYISNKYLDDCRIILDKLFSLDNDLVFGVCNRGLMGLSHDVAKEYNRDVFGICPGIYRKQLMDVSCTCEEVTTTVGERTRRVFEESDILLFLPGGVGTVYELFSAIEWKRSNELNKSIVIYNSLGYFDKLLELFDLIYENGFTSREIEKCYYVSNNMGDIINYIDSYNKGNDIKIRKLDKENTKR